MVWSRFLTAAEDEYLDAITNYERRQLGTGVRFRMELLASVERICQAPRTYRVAHYPNIRRARMRGRFPYSIYFREIEGGIEIVAVVHQSRRPGYWLERL